MADLVEGDKAPDFDLPANGETNFSLSANRGKIVVLYFYPKDDTSGCTKEAIEFTALSHKFSNHNAIIVGMSPDSAKKHDKFVAKHDLDVTLVSDEGKDTLQAYGVWVEKSMYGRKYMGVERSTFIIGRDGNVARVWRKVKVPGHAEEVLSAVQEL